MSDAVFIGVVLAVVGAVLSLVGGMMVRAMTTLKAEVLAAKAQLQALVTEVAVMASNHGHVTDRLALSERSSESAHKRLDELSERTTRLEAIFGAGNPEVRR